nr:DNA methyltransferase [Paenibacillus cymbidii]
MQQYLDFLKSKIVVAKESGFDVSPDEVNPIMKPHARDAVVWAIKGGRRGLFESFGLGKTSQQLEFCRIVVKHKGGKALIVLPLGVKQEFIRDAVELLGMEAPEYVRTMDEVRQAASSILLTNYERMRDGDIDPKYFTAVSLDEASILRDFGSKTYQTALRKFQGIPYKLVCTATPSPNKYKELIHYAAFLEIMDSGQALTRFFQRDSTKANNLTIYPHKEEEFWLWVSAWALFITRPSDLGHDDTGYDLPPLEIRYHEIPVDHSGAGAERDGQMLLLRDAALGLKDAAREKRDSIEARIGKAMELIESDIRRAQEEIPKGILREKQKTIVGASENSQQEKLSRQKGSLQPEIQSLERSEPRENEETRREGQDKARGKTEEKERGLVFEQQGNGKAADKATEIEEVWADGGRLSSAVSSTELSVRNMRVFESAGEDEHQPLCGSLPQDGGSAGPFMPEVQCRAGDVQGEFGINKEGGSVSKQFIIWCHLNEEQERIEIALKERGISVASVYGSLSVEEKERRLLDWKQREYTVLLSKPEILGSGANLQQCYTTIFVGINYSFNETIQSIHRIHRFGQQHPCEVHFIHMESEREILAVLLEKWRQHDYLVAQMVEIIKKYGLSGVSVIDKLARSIGVERVKIQTEHYTAVNNDCVLETAAMAENSIDLIHTSIPFSNHYEYTPSYNDFGHNEDTARFFEQMDFLTPQLLRILRPGRIAAIHVKDRVLFGNATGTGMPTIEPFHAICIDHYMRHGFQYMGMITVVTDVVRENNQTYRLGWSEVCKDGSKMGVGCPEYILLFRKLPTDRSTAYADEPVTKSKDEYTRAQWQIDAHAFWRSSGDRLLSKEELIATPVTKLQAAYRRFSRRSFYSYKQHVDIAKRLDKDGKLPAAFMVVAPGSWTDEVWDDINRMRTLNTTQSQKRQQMHVCPLQLDIVERIINRYSNAEDVVLDPFGGLMTVPMQAVKMGRRGYGIELNTDYFRDGVGYLKAAEAEIDMPTLFDFEDFNEVRA